MKVMCTGSINLAKEAGQHYLSVPQNVFINFYILKETEKSVYHKNKETHCN